MHLKLSCRLASIAGTTLGLCAIMFSACTHHLYQGDFEILDHQGKERPYRIYWTKTDPLIGAMRNSPVFIDIGCGRTEFTRRAGAQVLELPAQQYVLSDDSSSESTLLCGEIYSEEPLEELREGEIQLMVYCRPKVDQFSLYPSSFPMSRFAPYPVWINSSSSTSFSIRPPAPEALSCL